MTNLITDTTAFVKHTLAEAEGGHDWFHIDRVDTLATYIGEIEGNVNMTIVRAGALLHDIATQSFMTVTRR